MQNIIPTQILGTALTAAPVEGVLATLFMIVVGVGYLYWQVKKGHNDPEAAIELYQVQGGILDEKELEQRAPGFWISLLPMVVTFVLINGFGVELLYGLTAGCVLSLLFFCKSLGGVKGFGEIVSEASTTGSSPASSSLPWWAWARWSPPPMCSPWCRRTSSTCRCRAW